MIELVVRGATQGNGFGANTTIKYWLLKDEILKREIGLSDFAKALGITTAILNGNSTTPFPLDKIEKAIELLNDWQGPRRANSVRSVRPVKVRAVTKSMLIIP